MTTTTQTIVDPPTLSGFTTHYGIPVCGIGEEGELVALGRHEPRRAFAAFNRYVRTEWDWDLALQASTNWRPLPDRIRYEHFVVGTTCGECGNDPDCSHCREIKSSGGDWWLRAAVASDRTAFVVTIWT